MERRPEKAVTRSDFGGGREGRDEKEEVGAGSGGLGAERGGWEGKGRGFGRETCWVVH